MEVIKCLTSRQTFQPVERNEPTASKRLWREDFNEDSTLLCALDRIFDDATVFKLRGESFRGKKLETISLQTGKVKAVEPLAETEE